jgi:hypothetical protein
MALVEEADCNTSQVRIERKTVQNTAVLQQWHQARVDDEHGKMPRHRPSWEMVDGNWQDRKRQH